MHRSARRLVHLQSRYTPRRNAIPSFTRIAFARPYASQSEQPVNNNNKQQLLQEKDQRITELQVRSSSCSIIHQATTHIQSYIGSLSTMRQGP